MAEAKNGLKYCPNCNRTLPVSHFYKCKSRSDGLQVYCKDCKHKKTDNYYNEITRLKVVRNKDDEIKLQLIRKLLAMLKPYRKGLNYEDSKNRVNTI